MSETKRGSPSFLQRYLTGQASADDIDGCIDAWHDKPGRKKLFEFLGMTNEEYSLWLGDPDSLPEIAQARCGKLPLSSVVHEALDKMRKTGDPREKHLRRWLAQQAEPHPAK